MNNNLIINKTLSAAHNAAICVNCYNSIWPKHSFLSKHKYESIFGTKSDEYINYTLNYASYNCKCGEYYFQIIYYDNMIIKNINLIIPNFSISWNYTDNKCYVNNNLIPFETFDFVKIINQDLKFTKKIINKYLVLQ